MKKIITVIGPKWGKSPKIGEVFILEDGIISFYCTICGGLFLSGKNLEEHYGEEHVIEDHSLDVCSDLGNHDDHWNLVKIEYKGKK